MKWKKLGILISAIMILSLISMLALDFTNKPIMASNYEQKEINIVPSGFIGVPIIPNAANVTAEVLEVDHSIIIKTVQEVDANYSLFKLRIIESRNIKDYANLITVGSNITAYTRHDPEEDSLKLMEIQQGDTLEGIIRIAGDERGTSTLFTNVKKITPPMELPWMWIAIGVVTVAIAASTLVIAKLAFKKYKNKEAVTPNLN